jgi:hypothetical protein
VRGADSALFYPGAVVSAGVVLVFASMGMGILGLVKRGYELLVVLSMCFLLLLGFVLMAKGLLG